MNKKMLKKLTRREALNSVFVQVGLAGIVSRCTSFGADGMRPRVVVFGSSTAVGAGASRRELSWVELLKSASADAYDFSNISIAGDGSLSILERMDRDLLPLRPDFVILATSTLNDGLDLRDPNEVAVLYLKNIRLAVERIRNYGATAVVLGPYPCDRFDSLRINAIEMIYSELMQSGLLFADCWSALVSETEVCKWEPGTSVDGVHPNDLGHRHLALSIPSGAIGHFLALASSSESYRDWTQEKWAWRRLHAGVDLADSQLGFEMALVGSWSVQLSLSLDGNYTGLRPFAQIPESGIELWMSPTRVRIGFDNLYLPAIRLTSVLSGWVDVVMTYSCLHGAIAVYIEGEQVGKFQVARRLDGRDLRFQFFPASYALGIGYADYLGCIRLYRTNLSSARIRGIHENRWQQPSLEVCLKPVPNSEGPSVAVYGRSTGKVSLPLPDSLSIEPGRDR